MEIPKILLTSNGLSGINPEYRKSLASSKKTTFLGSELVEFHKDMKTYVPTYISVCPFCDGENKWRTTGALPDYISCVKCGLDFRQ